MKYCIATIFAFLFLTLAGCKQSTPESPMPPAPAPAMPTEQAPDMPPAPSPTTPPPGQNPPPTTTMPQASIDLQNAKVDAKAAVENLSDYTYTQKEAFVQKMRDNLVDLKKEIDDLGTKISQSTDEVKAAAKPKLEALDDQFDKLKAKLDNAEDATEDTWDNIKVDIKQSFDDLKKAYGDASQTVGTQSTPNQT